MSEDQVQDTFDNSEAPPRAEAEQSIKQATEEMASQEGFPAETVDGETVLIVEKRPSAADGRTLLIDGDGNEYVESGQDGVLEPADGETSRTTTHTETSEQVKSGATVESGEPVS